MNWNRLFSLLVVCVAVLWALIVPARAQISPLNKDGSLYLVQETSGSAKIYTLDRSTSPYTLTLFAPAFSGTTKLNALAYNPVDGFMYVLNAPTSGTRGLYRIGKSSPTSTTGTIESLGAITNSPAPYASYNAAGISPDGYFYFSNSNTGRETSTFYRINLNALGAAPFAVTRINLNQPVYVGDFAFGANGVIYAPSVDGKYIYDISVSSASTNATVNRRDIINTPANLQIGSIFFDGANELYAYSNNGAFYVIDIANASFGSVSTADPVSQSDGASVTDTPEVLDVIKSNGAFNQINARTFEVPYVVGVKNTGIVTAANVQVNDNLRLSFGSGNPTISIVGNPKLTVTESALITPTLNQNFNGDSDTKLFSGTDDYAPGAFARVAFTVRLVYPSVADVPSNAQLNSAYVSSVAGTTFTNPGYTYTAEGIPVAPINALTGEASSSGTTFPVTPNGDTPGGTGVTLPPIALEGRVYEDFNYGGGVGRAFNATQGMAGVPNARIEIYNSAGAFVAFTTSAADGTWSYAVTATGTYYARVVNSSVASTRTSNAPDLIGVQTFRTNNGGTVNTEVGGRAPASVDAGEGAAGTTYNATTFQLSGGGVTGQAQTVTPIVVTNTTDRSGFDFGFNFDTIVNTKDTGQGSLRQFVLNSNALANGGLAQQGLTAGVETSIFMIPSASDPLGRAKDPNFNNGVAKITLASGLSITGANAASTAIDGNTQTTNIGNTNAGTFGTGGQVGVQNIGLPTLQRPEIEIYGPRTIAVGLNINADSALVRGVAMWGFGSNGNTNSNATIRAGTGSGSSFIGPTIREVLLGTSAVPASDGALFAPVKANGVGNYGSGDLVSGAGVDNGQVLNSIIAYNGGKGIALNTGADGWTIQGNEIRDISRDSDQWDGIDAQVARTTITANLIYLSGGSGIDSYQAPGGTIARNNTVRNNGQLCTPTTGEPAGIRLYGTNNIAEFNIVFHNYGAGVLVQATGTALISRNSIYGNGQFAPVTAPGVAPSYQIGIDLLKAGDAIDHGTLPYVTPNDAGDPDVGGNGLLNFPIITGYQVANGTLTLEGFAPPGSTVEVFIADPDASGFGQGKTYLFSFVEGSAADLDNTKGAYDSATLQTAGYSATVANKAGSESNANRFRIVAPAGSVTNGTLLATTATLNNLTSEFSLFTGVIAINNGAGFVSGTVYLDANRNGTLDGAETGIGLNNLFIKAVLQNQTTAAQAVEVNATTGAYQFSGLAVGNYTLVLDDNANLSDITPAIPPGYVGTQSPNGTRQLTVGNQPVLGQDFGLYSGAQISGNVYEDNGIGGGIANDGIKNGGEVGLANVKLNLTNNAGTVIDTTTTDASGNFSFKVPNSLASSSLKVVEVNLTDTISTGATVGTTGGTYDRPSDTITFNYTAGATYSGLSFGDVRGATLTGEDAKTGIVGSSVFYPHVFRAQTAGSVVFSTSQLPSPANPDWSVVTFLDTNNNGQLDGADAQIGSAPIAVVAGQEITVFLQNFIPTTASNGAQDRLTITATFTASGTNAPPVQVLTRSDLTTVAAEQGLLLTKTVDKATAKSGDILLYTITYRNTGADVLTNLVVNDATPAYTNFVSAADGTRPPGLTGVTIASPSVGGKGAVKWTFAGSLSPGGSGTVTFRVKVD